MGLQGGGRTLTCTLGVGGSPWQDDLWERRRSQDDVRRWPPTSRVPLWPPHLRILLVLHGGPGGGERRGAVRAWERSGWGSCKHRPRANSRPSLPSPSSPLAPGLLPGPLRLGLTWGAGQRVLCWRLMWGWSQQWGPLDGSYGIVWRVQVLGEGSGGPAQLLAGRLITWSHPSCTLEALSPPASLRPHLEFQGWPDGQAPRRANQRGTRCEVWLGPPGCPTPPGPALTFPPGPPGLTAAGSWRGRTVRMKPSLRPHPLRQLPSLTHPLSSSLPSRVHSSSHCGETEAGRWGERQKGNVRG